ncbi:MAG: ABC transporter ATP-binding protein [Gemmataceae bacterium]
MLEIHNLKKTYRTLRGTVDAVENVSLTVAPEEFVAVVGPSGCGKTTLLLVAGGLLHPDGGTVRVNSIDPYQLGANERAQFRAKNIGFVFQQFHLIPYLSVLDNVLASGLAAPVADAKGKATKLLERFGLSHRLTHVPGELSTGEKQRTALARALLNDPPIVLADEPTGNLDEENGRRVLKHLAEYAQDGGAVLLVTHDTRAAQYATRMFPLDPNATDQTASTSQTAIQATDSNVQAGNST